MKKITLLLSSLILSVCAYAQAFSGTYAFDSVKTTSGMTDPSPLPTATGVTFGSFSATGTPANPNAAGRFSFTDWSTGATNGETVYTNLTGAINTGEYYEVTIAPAATYTLTLTSITFTFGRSGTGVRTYAVRSDADAYAVNLPASINPLNPNLSVQSGDVFFLNTDITTTSQNGSTITLSGASFTNITAARTFRFYGFNSEAATGTFSIDNVTINGTATAPAVLTAAFSSDVTTGCEDLTVNFTDMSTGPNTIVAWNWDFGDGSLDAFTQNTSHTYTAAGMYTVTLIIGDVTAATDTVTGLITVYEKPIAGFTAPMLVCDATAQFLDASTIASGSIVGWEWDFGDPGSGAANTSILEDPQHDYFIQNNYTATEIVTSDMGCKDTTTMMITVDSLGVSYTHVVTGPTVDFTGNVWGGSPPYTFMWFFGDGGTSAVMSPSYTYSSPGTYIACLIVTDNNGCVDSTCGPVTIITVGISQNEELSFSISPNPSNNGLFSILNAGVNASVSVFNLIGEQVLNTSFVQGNNLLDLSAQPSGSYFIRITNEKGIHTKKILISK